MSQRLPSEIFVPPLPSFPVPVAPPVTDGLPVALCIPANWLPYFRGACQQLIQAKTYKGTDSEIAAAQSTAATIIAMMEEGVCAAGYPTPYWDEGQDVDDDLPADTQPWYGEVTNPEAPPDELDFVEQAGIWGITGFIAYSGQIGAAIAFHSIAPAFVLAWHRGDIGEIWRVIVDAAEVGQVDTTSAAVNDVIEMPVAAGAGGHDILLVKVS